MNKETRTFIFGLLMLAWAINAVAGARIEMDAGEFHGFWDCLDLLLNTLIAIAGLNKISKTVY